MDNSTKDNAAIPSILQKIVATKQAEVIEAKQSITLDEIRNKAKSRFDDCHNLNDFDNTNHSNNSDNSTRGFAKALHHQRQKGELGIIAEIKKASPSKGIINHNFDPALFALQYADAGATCLSVLTDVAYFQGDDSYLTQARDACSLPILRKDFMIDPYQIYQSYLLGADCILLIMACLDDAQAKELHHIACQLGMDVLIEIHTEEELKRALKLEDLRHLAGSHNIYGINNRDLNTFTTDLNTSLRLKAQLVQAIDDKFDNSQNTEDQAIPTTSPLIVSESGIHSASDIKLMLDNDISSFLIGEQFMKTAHPGNTLQSLIASVSMS